MPVLAVLAVALAPARAHADKAGGLTLGYGNTVQERLGMEQSGHLLALGFFMHENDLVLLTDFELVVDQKYHDVTLYGLSTTVGYALGGETIGGYLGGAIGSRIEGYPDPSWSPMDFAGALGFYFSISSVTIGADVRYWLGLNWYFPRNDGDAHWDADPYLDWRAYVAVNFGG